MIDYTRESPEAVAGLRSAIADGTIDGIYRADYMPAWANLADAAPWLIAGYDRAAALQSEFSCRTDEIHRLRIRLRVTKYERDVMRADAERLRARLDGLEARAHCDRRGTRRRLHGQ